MSGLIFFITLITLERAKPQKPEDNIMF